MPEFVSEPSFVSGHLEDMDVLRGLEADEAAKRKEVEATAFAEEGDVVARGELRMKGATGELVTGVRVVGDKGTGASPSRVRIVGGATAQ